MPGKLSEANRRKMISRQAWSSCILNRSTLRRREQLRRAEKFCFVTRANKGLETEVMTRAEAKDRLELHIQQLLGNDPV
ncbi:MAG: hypothetical protein IPL70_16600 [Uliginosibacterium sp.]|nr:hypothetical protein [Uliginosibacterium sp.]